MMTDQSIFKDRAGAGVPMRLGQWGGLASWLMVVAIVGAHWVYLAGNLRDAAGPLVYSLADLLYGPVWGICLVAAVYALREWIGEVAPRRLNLALVIALIAAVGLVAVASVRSANRYYHLTHPELNLQSSATVLTVWATLVAGLIGAALHSVGWVLVLIGSAGWTSGRLPRVLSGLHLAAGAVALGVFLFPGLEGTALVLVMVASLWQGIVLWRGGSSDMPGPAVNFGQADNF